MIFSKETFEAVFLLLVLVQIIRGDVIPSEVSQIVTMGSYAGTIDPQINCPHKSSGLLQFNSLFSSVSSNSNIIIPSGNKVLISKTSSVNSDIIINRILVRRGATLIFDDTDISINVNEIYVEPGGALIVGSETCRIQSKITITFYGSKTTSSVTDSVDGSGTTSKGLVSNGAIDMHGKQFHPTWTRLARTVTKGSTTLYLQNKVNWEAGQEILITTTVFHDCPDEWVSWCDNNPHQNEVRMITSISMDDASKTYSVSFSQGLSYDHYGGYEYQGEVALLSRNINLKGYNSGDNFGGHVKVKGVGAIGRFSGVRGDNMGQLNVLGRYPFNFDLLGDNKNSSSSFFQDCSVTNSNFRCFVVHGSNHTRVSRNVAYKAKGMCYYLEDGVEENNLLEFNLAAHISPINKPADGQWNWNGEVIVASANILIPADASAGGFYISNAMNSIVGNAASGGWTGFSFIGLPSPLGSFKGKVPTNSYYNPHNRPTLKFTGNTAHSEGHYWYNGHGSCIYTGGKMYYDSNNGGKLTYLSGWNQRPTTYGNGSETALVIENTKVFQCLKGIVSFGDRLKVQQVEVHDFLYGVFTYGFAALDRVLMNMNSMNPHILFSDWSTRVGFQFPGPWSQALLFDVTFRNITNSQQPGQCAITYDDWGDSSPSRGGASVSNIKFDHVIPTARICLDNCGPLCNTVKSTMSSRTFNVLDWDGSLSGKGVPTLIGSNVDWWNVDNTCSFDAVAHLWSCPWRFQPDNIGNQQPSTVSNHTVVYLQPYIPGLFDGCDTTLFPNRDDCSDSFSFYTAARMSLWGYKTSERFIDIAPWSGIPGLSNVGWYFRAKSSALGIDGAPSVLNFNEYYNMAPGSFIVMAIAYPTNTQFTVKLSLWGTDLGSIAMASSLAKVTALTENLVSPDQYVCGPNWNSMCSYTGGSGFQWYFDGKYLYLRLVPFDCYNNNRRWDCHSHYREAYGIKAWGVQNGFQLSITTTCTSCTIQSTYKGVNYYAVTDEPPERTLQYVSLGLSSSPTPKPTVMPSSPTVIPTRLPTITPTLRPSPQPTIIPKPTLTIPSEVVGIITMGSANGVADPQLYCPHMASGLTNFNSLFPTVSSGQDIVISAGKNVIVTDSSSINGATVLNRILIKAGASLVFDDKVISINVREIFVEAGGALKLGSELCRLQNKITITFYGSKSDSSSVDIETASSITSKGLVASGIVDMHGKQYHPTWTRLARTVTKGSTTLYLQNKVNWEAGQEILITTTVFHDCPDEWMSWCDNNPHQNEVRVITSISMDDASKTYSVSFSQGLSYDHYGGYEYQGEVALLSRNINLKGYNSGDNFGGHVKVRGHKAIGRFSGVRGDNMGQLNVLGRYPFHFHILGDNENSSSSFFQDCSVTNSNFRCFVVHGTNHTRVSRNVAYKAKGMCYYLEDGVEENNLLEFNLAAHILPIYRPANGGWGQGGEYFTSSSDLIVPADTSAAGFYISNAMNRIIGNAASGGWTGFAFPNIPAPLGVFQNTIPSDSTYNPQNRPLLKFYGNTAHSAGYYWDGHGNCMYVGANLYYDPNNNGVLTYMSGRNNRQTIYPNYTSAVMLFENTKVFLCMKGIAHWGNTVQIDRAEFHDVVVSAMLFGEAAMHNALVNIHSRNPHGAFLRWNQRMGFQFYDTWVQTILSNVTFRNLTSRRDTGDCAIRYMDHSDHYIPQGINSVTKILFQNVAPDARVCIDHCGSLCNTNYVTMSSKIYSVWDWDGSLSGKGVPTIMGSNIDWWNVDSSCSRDPNTYLWSCPWKFTPWSIKNSPSVPERTVVHVQFYVSGLMDGCDTTLFPNDCTDQYAPYTVGRLSQWGYATSARYVDMGAWPGVSGMSHMGWYWRTKSSVYGIDGAPSQFRLDEYGQMAAGSFVVVAIAYPAATQFTVQLSMWGENMPVTPMASSLTTVLQPSENLVSPDQYVCGPNWNSMCSYTGGAGLQWYFDGKYLYLRIVPFRCYNNYFKNDCWGNYFGAYSSKVWSVLEAFRLTVTATCSGCTVQKTMNGIKYFSVADTPPSQTLSDTYSSITSGPKPSTAPTKKVTGIPTRTPSSSPTTKPSSRPTIAPTTPKPSTIPTTRPTVMTAAPSKKPTSIPTNLPTRNPSMMPSRNPTRNPSQTPSRTPTRYPTMIPSRNPSRNPSVKPTVVPTAKPTIRPTTNIPTKKPTMQPTTRPSTSLPTQRPIVKLIRLLHTL